MLSPAGTTLASLKIPDREVLQHRWAASFQLEHLDQVAEQEAVQEIEIYQHHVLNGTTKHASRK